jgi:hypothetical protein
MNGFDTVFLVTAVLTVVIGFFFHPIVAAILLGLLLMVLFGGLIGYITEE